MKSKVRCHEMAACVRNRESKKSSTIPIHQRVAMRVREPRSRAPEESTDRFAFQANTSGSVQIAKAIQKMKVKTGPAANGKGRNCISWIVYILVCHLPDFSLANRTVGRILSSRIFGATVTNGRRLRRISFRIPGARVCPSGSVRGKE